MKKALFATTALVLSAGVAAADVTISGYGRTGVIYIQDRTSGGESVNNAQVESRLRMNIDASTSTDGGVDFGARFRLQWNQGQDSAQTNAAKLWVSASGVTVEVGNIDTAFDSTGLRGATELGVFDRSVGFSDVADQFFAYNSKAYNNPDYVGVRVVYAVDDLKVQGSFVDPDQSGRNETDAGYEEEFGVAVDYKWDGRLELSAAAVFNAAGYDNDMYFLGARYAFNDQTRVGLNFSDGGKEEEGFDGQTVALYGDYTLADGLTNIEAYVAYNNADRDIATWKETNTAMGIGVNYDLGGARLGASVQRGYDKNTTADMGVRFDF